MPPQSPLCRQERLQRGDRKSTRLNSSHRTISYFYTFSLHDALPIFDNLLATLRNLRMVCSAAGKTNELKSFEAAILVAEDYRQNLLPLRPPISVLRNASAVTSLQTGTATKRRSEEHTSELQSPYDLVLLHFFPTRRSSDL